MSSVVDGGLDALIATACGSSGQQAEAALKKLLGTFAKAVQPGKENGNSRQQQQASALQCFKAAQAKLAQGGGSATAAISLGQASLAALEAQAGGDPSSQLLPLRYNFVKRLMAAGAHEAAWLEASVLHDQLVALGPPQTAEAASIAVGAVLMLLLCCLEARQLAEARLKASLQAVRMLEVPLGKLPPADAGKHRDAAFKYLYKVAAQLLEWKAHAQVPAVVAAMASVAVGEQQQERVLQAALKFCAHLPDAAAVEAAAAAVSGLLESTGQGQLPDTVALEMVSLLCTACQRSTGPAMASSTWSVLQQCISAGGAILQQAALLLPCLALGESGGCGPAGWPGPVMEAAAVARASAAALQRHAVQPRLQPKEVMHHAGVVAAAFQPANLLRRALARQEPGAACVQLGGGDAVAAVAAQLELLGDLVSSAARIMAASEASGDALLPAQVASVGRQGHAAAVGLATAAKLKAACCMAPVVDTGTVADLLGWEFGAYCSAGVPLSASGGGAALSGQELSWLVAALYNVGVDLYGEGQFEAAIPPLQSAVSASISCLVEAVVEGSGEEVVAERAQDVARRGTALADAQLRAGGAAAAARTLAHAVAAMVECGLGPAAWQDLLSSLAKQSLEALLVQHEHASAASGAPSAPAPKGKAVRSGKGGASSRSRTGREASASGGSAQGEPPAGAPISCSEVLSGRAAGIPAGLRAAVGELELAAWAALAGAGSAAAAPRCAQLCGFLLSAAFPAGRCPLEHARILLAAYQADVAAEDFSGQQLLEQAVLVLKAAEQGAAAASALAARAHGLLCLDAAQQLVQQSMLQQRQQRQEAQEAAAAAGSLDRAGAAAAAVCCLPHVGDQEVWRSAAAHAEAALRHMQAAMEHQTGQHLSPEDWASLAQLAAELGYMAALQGDQLVEMRCRQLCLDVLSSTQPSPRSRLLLWAAITPAADWLTSCLLPGYRQALGLCMPGLAASLQASWPCSLAGLGVRGAQHQLAALHGCLAELAAGPRSAGSTLQRACLHRLVAEQEAGAGNVMSALFHATEAHRLVLSAAPSTAEPQQPSPAGTQGPSPVGWWQLAAEQLCSLAQLGRLFELSGMPDEALHALKEGLRMAVSMGSGLLAAAFRIQLADIYTKQGSAAAAQQALGPVPGLLGAADSRHPGPLLAYLRAQLDLVEARCRIAAGDLAGAWERSQAAAKQCCPGGGGAAGGAEDAWLLCSLAAMRASALLAGAECLAGQGEGPAAARLAAEAAQALGGRAGACSSGLQPRVEAALFLALQEPTPSSHAGGEQEGIYVWGLSNRGSGTPCELADKRKAAPAAKQRAAGKGAARAKSAKEPATGGDQPVSARMQHLWRAYWLTREVPHINRVAAAHLARECGAAGYPYLAALLLHASLGSTMRQQYRLVLHTKLQQQQQQQQQRAGQAPLAGGGEGGDHGQCATLQAALSELAEPLDGQLVLRLAGQDMAAGQQQQPPPAKGRRLAAAPAAPPAGEAPLLAELDRQAEAALQRWVAALPEGTVVCSLSAQPDRGRGGGANTGSGSGGARLVVSRLAAGAVPVVAELQAGASAPAPAEHPIKALRLDPEEGSSGMGGGADSGGIHAVVEGLLCLLEDSGRSMRDMATDTREQQREWWHARQALDDRLAALLGALDTAWLACWRCLLLGAAAESTQDRLGAAERLVQQLQDHAAQASLAQLSPRQLEVARAILACLLEASSELGPDVVRDACSQLCGSLELGLEPGQVSAALQQCGGCGTGSGTSSGAGSSEVAPGAAPAPARARRAAATKSVSFSVEPAGAEQQRHSPARTRRPATRGSRVAAAAAAASQVAEPESEGQPAEGGSPPARGKVAGAGELCVAFDALSLQQQQQHEKAAALTTARASKHRSRLKMMQARSPGPAASASRRAVERAAVNGAATAPRLRGEGSAAAAGASSSASGGARPSGEGSGQQRGAVLLVLDGRLQALPWESVPGLQNQRIYRMPSLPCAAASAQRSQRGVDLASTFYALNPSGDLCSTQSAFQDWFARLRWEGKAGEPPTAAELAGALQSRQLFVYFGHGGGEQYIPAAKLRSLDRCAAALLMGCSSGRLRLQRHYEPAGAVLAYLLAGCPAAVSNLWDVTDKDIDRFSQALLSTWLDGGCDSSSSYGRGGGGGGSDGDPNLTMPVDISRAVAQSRGICKLPHLIGASPVCYGLPTAVLGMGMSD